MPKSTTKSTNAAARRHEQYPRFPNRVNHVNGHSQERTDATATRPTPGWFGLMPNGSRVPWSNLIRRESGASGASSSSVAAFRDWRRSNLVLVLDEALRIAREVPSATGSVSPLAASRQSYCPPSPSTMTTSTAQDVEHAQTTASTTTATALAAVTSSTMNDNVDTELQHFEDEIDTSSSTAEGSDLS